MLDSIGDSSFFESAIFGVVVMVPGFTGCIQPAQVSGSAVTRDSVACRMFMFAFFLESTAPRGRHGCQYSCGPLHRHPAARAGHNAELSDRTWAYRGLPAP